MKRTSSRLLLGLLGVATSAGLVLGGKAVGDNVAKGAAEVAAAAAGDTYVKVSEQLTDWTGKYIIASEGFYFDGSADELDGDNQVSSTLLAGNSLNWTEDFEAASFEVVKRSDGTYDLKTIGGTYIYRDTGTSSGKLFTSATSPVVGHEFSYEGGNVWVYATNGTQTYYLTKNSQTDTFRYYVNKKQDPLTLYKLVESTVEVPEDEKPVSITIAAGTGATTVLQGSEFDPTGYIVDLTYGSESVEDYERTVSLAVTDERLTWNIDTSTIGDASLTLTFVEGDVNLTSNSVSVEVLADDFAGYVTDVLTNATFGVTGTTYKDNSVTGPSGITYSANSAGDYSSIQLRSEKNSGIVTTTTIGTVDLIEITFNTNSNDERVIDIYGSHEPFSSPADLYSGSSIGSIAYADGQVGTLDISALNGAPYEYIGIRSRKSAIYIDQIRIGYTEAATPTDAEVVAKFVADYMHMDDYDADKTGVGTGACLGEGGYYQVAMTAFLELTPEQQELFKTGDEFADARKRYEAWAHFNGDDTPYDGSFNPSLAARIDDEAKADYWVVGGISLAVIGLAAGLFFLRKKKEA